MRHGIEKEMQILFNAMPEQKAMPRNKSKLSFQHYWSAHELVVIGVFSAAAKVSTLLISLAGGGMNPVTLLLKNLVFTTMLMVMLYKVRKQGTLFLFVTINLIFSMLLMGAGFSLLPAMLLAAALGELAAMAGGGLTARFGPLLAVAVYDLAFRCGSLGISWIMLRETPGLVLAAVPVVILGYLGAIGGLYTGIRSVRELRHAGIVRF